MSKLWDTIELTSGGLTLVCLPGIGGRLWDIVFKGKSLLFQNPDLLEYTPDIDHLENLPTKSPQFKFPLWGGEKTWIAPDSSWLNYAPFPVLDSGPYDADLKTSQQLRLLSPICPLTQIQIERLVTLYSPNHWSIEHQITNCGETPRFAGIWSVMMLKTPALISMDCSNHHEVSTVFGDPDGFIQNNKMSLVFDCFQKGEFKIGAHNLTDKTTMNMSEELYLTCRVPTPLEGDRFAHSHNIEVFNSGDYPYCEVEWHAPATILARGDSNSFTQHFNISTKDQ